MTTQLPNPIVAKFIDDIFAKPPRISYRCGWCRRIYCVTVGTGVDQDREHLGTCAGCERRRKN